MAAVFTVYFESPFWVGVLESEEEGRIVVAREVFGGEPGNAELLDFMLYRFALVPRFERKLSGAGGCPPPRVPSPKRALREAMRDRVRTPSTKAQAALKASREESRAESSSLSREESLAQGERRFELRAQKRKKKRAGH